MTKIATWNVNSIRARVPIVVGWLKRVQPDVLLLQETKCLPEKFPAEAFDGLNYNIELIGEPSLNGVAILAKSPIEDVVTRLPGDDEDGEARYIEGRSRACASRPSTCRTARRWTARAFRSSSPFSIACAPMPKPCSKTISPWSSAVTTMSRRRRPTFTTPRSWRARSAIIRREREKWRTLTNIGLYDAYRAALPDSVAFSWWHYQERSFQLGHGLRIDHLLLSPSALDRLETVEIDEEPRRQKNRRITRRSCVRSRPDHLLSVTGTSDGRQENISARSRA